MRHRIKWFDDSVTRLIVMIFGEKLRPVFVFITTMGDPILMLITAVIVGTVSIQAELTVPAAVSVAIPISLLAGAGLKRVFERARPLTEYAMKMRIHTHSFPSGHSTGSVVGYASVASLALHMPLHPIGALIVPVVAVAVPFMIGISRVYLGAHFPSDVVAGWVLGSVGVGAALAIGNVV